VLQSFWLEILLSAMLMLVIISVVTDTKAIGTPAALAIAFTVALDAMWGGPISGASMNPARSLGPALVAGTWEHQWVYLIAPVLGAAIGVTLYQWIREPQNELQETSSITGNPIPSV
jgi:aquaporin NIP